MESNIFKFVSKYNNEIFFNKIIVVFIKKGLIPVFL